MFRKWKIYVANGIYANVDIYVEDILNCHGDLTVKFDTGEYLIGVVRIGLLEL